MTIKNLSIEDTAGLSGEYCYIQRDVDGYVLENSAAGGHVLGAFYSEATVTDKKIPLVESGTLPGVYVASENRLAFDDGAYTVRYCRASGVIIAVEYWCVWEDAVWDGETSGTVDLTICNNALLLLGNNTIVSLTDDLKAARLCSQFYQQAVDAVLRAYTWNCATVRSAELVAAGTPSFGFGYAYVLPAFCLRVLMIEDDETIPFKIENGQLVTDYSAAKITYIKRVAMSKADSLLVEAISARLAAAIAFPVTNSATVSEAMWKLYKDKLDEAQTIDAFEGTASQLASNDWINSRG